MKKFIYGAIILVAVLFAADYAYYSLGFYIDLNQKETTTFVKNIEKDLYMNKGKGYEPFEIKGVNMGIGIPGHFATEYAITKEDYLRWFAEISAMGANTIRVYTILHDDFYDAVYEYNKDNDKPLYILHGVWVNDYVQNSRVDAYDKEFIDAFIHDSLDLVDVIHGNKRLTNSSDKGSGSYKNDISPWVMGYILGVEWEDATVVYTNHMQKDQSSYTGKYLYTTRDSTPFEAMLARVGDEMIAYESQRYHTQRLMAFSNWPTTDPFDYPKDIATFFHKIAKVDVEHIKMTEEFISGTFASYHVYPYYPDYLSYFEEAATFTDETGAVNTYQAYLRKLQEYHTIPVVIAEFGIPTSRGMAQRDKNTERNQGAMSEKDQGKALVACYKDIQAAGCAGSILFSWQDEWFKRTWNTMHGVDLLKTPYWSDYQTNEQYFGLLAFDPGKKESVCYVDGDRSEWKPEDLIADNGDTRLSMKYDEKFIYLLAYKKDFQEEDTLYIPIDSTPKSGSRYCENYDVGFQRPVDFVLTIDGKENSRIVVQERYACLRAMFFHETDHRDAYENPPAVDTPVFRNIDLILQTSTTLHTKDPNAVSETYETGLLTYGNANPGDDGFDSLADFCFGGEYVEIKIPWQLLNFSNPSEMIIHDDYYLHYGIEKLPIDDIYIGIAGEKNKNIPLFKAKLKGWGTKVTYHERLKQGYYDMQKIWGNP